MTEVKVNDGASTFIVERYTLSQSNNKMVRLFENESPLSEIYNV